MLKKLTQGRLKQLLHYDEHTGVFTYKKKGRKKIAGYDDGRGYLLTVLDGERHYNHRLAWLYTHGYLPENVVDHINRNPSDNRMCNLREVSFSCNAKNVPLRSNNTSGVTGVHWNKGKGKWEAYITNLGKRKGLGFTDDLEIAVLMRYVAEKQYNWVSCSGGTEAHKFLVEKGLHNDTFIDYAHYIWKLWLHNEDDDSPRDAGYATEGLIEEIGELAGKFKRLSRGEKVYSTDILQEAGDIIWNLSQLCVIKGIDLNIFAEADNRVKTSPPSSLSSTEMLLDMNTHIIAFYNSYEYLPLSYFLITLLSGVFKFTGGNLEDIIFVNKLKVRKRYKTNKIIGSGDYR